MSDTKQVFVLPLNDQPEYQRILEGRPQSHGMRSGRVYIEPGAACGQHSTKNHEELLVFLSGQGQLLIGPQGSFSVGRGRVSYIPPNTLHDVRNTGSEPLVYIYCVAPVSGPGAQ
jgi:mannose-6-phosphate isomerase-like protein (cupin superfamily)